MEDEIEEAPETASAAPSDPAMQRRYQRHDILRIAVDFHPPGSVSADTIVETARKFAAFVEEA